MIGSQLLRYNKKQKYLIPDAETCHLNLGIDNYPWQFAWIIATQDEILEKHNHLLNWGDRLRVSDGAARATGFDPSLVARHGEDPRKVYQKFKPYLDNDEYKIVGQNLLNFDIYIENQWAIEIGEKHDWNYLERLIDTNAVAKAIEKNIKPDHDNFLAWQFRVIGYVEKGLKTNLSYLCKKYKLEIDESRFHKADYDIEKNWEVFCKQMWEIEI